MALGVIWLSNTLSVALQGCLALMKRNKDLEIGGEGCIK